MNQLLGYAWLLIEEYLQPLICIRVSALPRANSSSPMPFSSEPDCRRSNWRLIDQGQKPDPAFC